MILVRQGSLATVATRWHYTPRLPAAWFPFNSSFTFRGPRHKLQPTHILFVEALTPHENPSHFLVHEHYAAPELLKVPVHFSITGGSRNDELDNARVTVQPHSVTASHLFSRFVGE